MNRDKAALSQILERIQLAIEFAGRDKDRFMANRMGQEAVIRELEVIGEATKRVSLATRARSSGVPWKGMAGFKDAAIHQYDSVDLDRVWAIVSSDLPAVRAKLRTALARLADE